MKLCNKHQSNLISARSSNLEVSAAPCYVQDPGVYIQCCKAEKSAQVMREMENYSIDIPSMSGYRWSGTDCIKLKNNNKIMNYWGSPAAGKQRSCTDCEWHHIKSPVRLMRNQLTAKQQVDSSSKWRWKPSKCYHGTKPLSKTSYRTLLRVAHSHWHDWA